MSEVYVLDLKISSIVMSQRNGEVDNYIGKHVQAPLPLLELVLDELSYSMETNKIDFRVNKKEQANGIQTSIAIEQYFSQLLNMLTRKQGAPTAAAQPRRVPDSAFIPPYSVQKASLSIYGTYYNQLSQAFEPFIEPWSVKLTIKQEDEKEIQKLNLESSEYLNFNFTYGMAVAIKDIKNRLIEKTFKIDDQLKHE
jgi:hypothetical protein